MELGSLVRFNSKVGTSAAIVNIDAIFLKSESDKSLVLVSSQVPGVQCLTVSGESHGLTWVQSSSLSDGWLPQLGSGDFGVQIPKAKLPSLLARLLEEDAQVFTSASEEGVQPEDRMIAFESMGRNLQKAMLDMSGVVKEIQSEVRGLKENQSQSSHSQDWSLLQGSSARKSNAKAQLSGLSSNRKLWQGVIDGDLADEDDEDDEVEHMFVGKQKPSLVQHAAGLFAKVPTNPSMQPDLSQVPPDNPVNMDRLIQLEMLKLLAKGKKTKVDSSTDSDSSDTLSSDKLRGKGFKGVRKLRRRYHRHPRKLINSYVVRAKEIIGVHHRDQRWGFRDLSAKIKRTFGKMNGLWRCHLILQEVIQLQLADDHVHATALTCQLSKAIHQVAVDHGNWETALLLIPLPDAVGDTPFGGDEDELESIHAYMKSLRELKLKVNSQADKGEDEKDDTVDAAPKKGARGSR